MLDYPYPYLSRPDLGIRSLIRRSKASSYKRTV